MIPSLHFSGTENYIQIKKKNFRFSFLISKWKIILDFKKKTFTEIPPNSIKQGQYVYLVIKQTMYNIL